MGDTGVGGVESLEGGLPADLPPLFGTAAEAFAEQAAGTGDPGAFEGVDDDSAGIPEDGVIEGEGFGRGRD